MMKNEAAIYKDEDLIAIMEDNVSILSNKLFKAIPIANLL